MTVAEADFDFIRQLVQRRTAIILEPGKEYLALSRLDPIARREGLGSVSELIQALRTSSSPALQELVVEAMMTNETSFFRDVHPFDSLRTHVIPEVMARNAAHRTLSIWCAACSSGQEPYSVAMVLKEHFPQLADWSVLLLATDLSGAILSRAREGRFGQLEVNRGLPAHLLVKYFHHVGVHWELDESVRRMVTFERQNLVDTWQMTMPAIDIVFLRNVMIYFDVATKISVLDRVRRVLRPDGYLLLGGSESTINLGDSYERQPIGRTIWYRPRVATGPNGSIGR